MKIYRNSGLKPAVKAALHDLGAGASRRRQALFYARSLFSEEQRESTELSGYCIVKTGNVKPHRDMVCELDKVIEERQPAVIYMDELRDGELLYKPDYAPDNLMAHNYIGNCVVVRRDLMDDCAVKLSGKASLWSFNKYICGRCREEEIAHVSRALFEDKGHIGEDGDNIKDSIVDGFENASNGKCCKKISVIIPNYEHADDLRRLSLIHI